MMAALFDRIREDITKAQYSAVGFETACYILRAARSLILLEELMLLCFAVVVTVGLLLVSQIFLRCLYYLTNAALLKAHEHV